MPLDRPAVAPASHRADALPLASRVADLNAQSRGARAADVIAMAAAQVHSLALVSSFGAESVVLLHLVSRVRPDLPVLFIDTEMLFASTLTYQQDLTRHLGLTNVTILRSGHSAQADPDGILHRTDPDACCALRKTAPLQTALNGFDGWITGRKRYQSDQRAGLEHFECEDRSPLPPRLKVNPLAHWAMADVADYIEDNALPRHPLVARGYPSIGCAPCTSAVAQGEDPRAGRWRDQSKAECGIHFSGGKMVRTGDTP